MLKQRSCEFSYNHILSEVNLSRKIWAVREIKRTCGDGPKDILCVVGDKSDVVRLTLDLDSL